MKKMMTKFVAVLVIIAAFSIVSFAQSNSKIVVFAKGKKSAVEKFTLPGGDGITYIISAKQWNLMHFTVTGMYTDGTDAQGLTIKLTKLGSEKALATASPGEEVEYQFDKDGDRVITVMNPGKRKANITLNVSINR